MTTDVAPARTGAPRVEDLDGRTVQVISTAALSSELEPRRVGLFVGTWAAVLALGVVLVLYGIGPYLHARDQRVLLETYRASLGQAANEAFGLEGIKPPTKAPAFGEPVAILEIGSLRLQEVVVEGAAPAHTQRGPGHVPGTAIPGQPYNSVIIGRAHTFGGPFGQLAAVNRGDPILVTTTEGQRVYTVESVRWIELLPPGAEKAAQAADGQHEQLAVDDLYALGDEHKLTLVTSDAARPWNARDAVVVTAKMRQVPYVDWTPPNGRTDLQTGLTGDASSLPALMLVVLGFVVAAAMAVALYRTRPGYVAYLVSTPPLLAFVVLGAEMIGRLLPAWI